MLVAIWNMTITGTLYDDPRADFYIQLNPDRAKGRAIDQLRNMGYTVTLSPLEGTSGQGIFASEGTFTSAARAGRKLGGGLRLRP